MNLAIDTVPSKLWIDVMLSLEMWRGTLAALFIQGNLEYLVACPEGNFLSFDFHFGDLNSSFCLISGYFQ